MVSPEAGLFNRHTLARLAAAVVFGVTGGAVVAPDEIGHDAVYGAAVYAGRPLPRERAEAPAAEAWALERVSEEFSKPQPSYAIQAEDRFQQLRDQDPHTPGDLLFLQAEFEVLERVAAERGLTVFNPIHTLKVLQADINAQSAGKEAMLPEEYIAFINGYLSQFGIRMDPTNPHPETEYFSGLRPLGEGTTLTVDQKQALYTIALSTSRYPLEFIQLAGVTAYLLGNKEGSNVAAYVTGKGQPHGNAIVFNVAAAGNSQVVGHEQSHKVDMAISGGFAAASNDPDFTGISDVEYDPTYDGNLRPRLPGEPMTFDGYRATRSARAKQLRSLSGQACLTLAAQHEAALRPLRAETLIPSRYSIKSGLEHKAEIGQSFIDGYGYKLLSLGLDELRDQLLHQAARLYEYRPNLALYFIDLTSRPEEPDPLASYCT